jgi:hypothetical protein
MGDGVCSAPGSGKIGPLEMADESSRSLASPLDAEHPRHLLLRRVVLFGRLAGVGEGPPSPPLVRVRDVGVVHRDELGRVVADGHHVVES